MNALLWTAIAALVAVVAVRLPRAALRAAFTAALALAGVLLAVGGPDRAAGPWLLLLAASGLLLPQGRLARLGRRAPAPEGRATGAARRAPGGSGARRTAAERARRSEAAAAFGGRDLPGYTILEKVGAGGMATVYRATRDADGREVALKIPMEAYAEDEAFLRRFHREAEIAQRLDHPNVVTTFDHGAVATQHYMAMEFVEGRSLEALLEAGPLSATAFADVAKPVVSALQAIHAAGVVHRDVKPSNVLVEGGELREGRPHVPPGAVRLMDFGIAGTTLLSRLTVTGTRVGTPVYMSPEQAQGETMDARSDVYSLGLVFYEMLTGGTAFEGAYETVVHQQVHRTPPPPRQRVVHVPPALDALVMRMIAKDPGDRPDLREVLAVLQDEANWGAGLEVDAPFRLWTVLEVREGVVRTWTPDGRVLAGVADVGPDTLSSVPRDLAVDAHGRAYLLRHERRAVGGGAADHAVVVLDEGGATQGLRVPIGADPDAVARPDRVAVTADGEVRVLDAAAARVVRYAPDGAPAGAFALQGTPHAPATLQATADGGTLLFDPGRRDVQRYAADGRFVTRWAFRVEEGGDERRELDGAYEAEDGTLYVGDATAGRIRSVRDDGRLGRTYRFEPRRGESRAGVLDLAVDGDGRLYAGRRGGTVVRRFAADGTLEATLDLHAPLVRLVGARRPT
ncbi:MAG: serine/threonine-protein kinase [Trueperaceae bacterium]|nr:serine/threonine-protein kinase [Trueperaceae bacterium]